MNRRILTFFLALIALTPLAGCSPMVITGSADVEKSAFGSQKRFAVVSIAARKTISAEKGFTQMFKDTDEIPGADTQPLINALKSKIIKDIAKDKNIALLAENKVLRSKAYKRAQEDERKMKVLFMSDTMNVAPGYKYIATPEKYAQLARELNVDGVIGITMGFSITSGKGGFSINGLSFGSKSYSPVASISAVAYDKQGQVIWKDSTMKQAEPGDKKAIFLLDFSDMTSTNYLKMHPKAIEIGGKAIEVLLARLDDTLAGKGSSSVQGMK